MIDIVLLVCTFCLGMFVASLLYTVVYRSLVRYEVDKYLRERE